MEKKFFWGYFFFSFSSRPSKGAEQRQHQNKWRFLTPDCRWRNCKMLLLWYQRQLQITLWCWRGPSNPVWQVLSQIRRTRQGRKTNRCAELRIFYDEWVHYWSILRRRGHDWQHLSLTWWSMQSCSSNFHGQFYNVNLYWDFSLSISVTRESKHWDVSWNASATSGFISSPWLCCK